MDKAPIVITGFMGCGKSEVARCLARRLKSEMLDLDEVITSLETRSPATLISEDGEPAFRIIETRTLVNVLSQGFGGVIALGGGAWIESSNRELIAQSQATSVWLDVPFPTCWARIEADSKDRPLGRTCERAKELFSRRRPIYQLARIHIEVTGEETPDNLAAMIQSELLKETAK